MVPTSLFHLLIEKPVRFLKKITPGGSFVYLLYLDWSPDGDEILFQTFDTDGGTLSIGTIKTDGTHQQKILQDSNYIFSPRWSADGNHIYYLRTNGNTRT